MMAAAAAFLGGGAVASAADLGSYKDTPYSAPAPVWSGFYIGGHFGGLWGNDADSNAHTRDCNSTLPTVGPPLGGGFEPLPGSVSPGNYCTHQPWYKVDYFEFGKDDGASFLGGAHLGYNWQYGATVFGIEGDVSFADQVDYLATLRARLGYAHENLLLYATAGVAFAGFDDSTFKATALEEHYEFESDGDRKVGFVIGGGLEYKLRPNWSVGVEGLYYVFGQDDEEYLTTIRTHTDYWVEYKFADERDRDLWTARARLTYHFGEDHATAPLK